MRMLKVCADANFREEPLAPDHRAQLGVEHLGGDEAPVLDVAREVDSRHAAVSELTLGPSVPAARDQSSPIARLASSIAPVYIRAQVEWRG